MQANKEIIRTTALRVYVTVKGYHKCKSTVTVGEHFSIGKKRGERGNALRVYNRMGHLQNWSTNFGRLYTE